MSLFKRRENLEDYFHIVYDSYLSVEWGAQAGKFVAENMKKELSQIDFSFIDIDIGKLALENEYLRFEISSLAWAKRFLENGSAIVGQSLFTKRYLNEHGRDDIWVGMEAYNKAIIEGNARIPILQADFMKKYVNGKNDFQCCIMAANRYGIGILFKNFDKFSEQIFIGAFFRKYVSVLCNRLGFSPDFEPNEEANSYLIQFLSSFYNECLKSFNEIKI